MRGPTSKPKIGLGIGWLELFSTISGLVVVLGLWMESGSEIWTSIATHTWPRNPTIGSVLVTFGVFLEVALGILIAPEAKRAEIESARIIAELNNETERLRKEANETALLLTYRSLGDARQFENAMREFKGTPFVLEVSTEGNEPSHFHWLLDMSLKRAEWIKVRKSGRRTNIGFGVAIMTIGPRSSSQDARPVISPAANALAEWLNGCSVSVLTMVIAREDLEPGTVVVAIGPMPETTEQRKLVEESYKIRQSEPLTPPQA